MKYQQDRAWMEISLDAIEENYRRIQDFIGPERKIMAVVKADAYGLGALPISRALEKLGCPYFSVACLEEAMELREGGIQAPILTLGPIFPQHVALAIQNGIRVPAVSLEQAKALSQAAVEAGGKLTVHIKADVGLARFGLVLTGREKEAAEEALAIAALPGLTVEGVFTHYTAVQLGKGDHFNREQINRFDTFCSLLRESGLTFLKHSASSYFAAVYPESHNDCVRVAALLLGLEAPAERGVACAPSAQLKTRIWQIKEIPEGVPVGYGPTVHTLRPTRLAVIPLGFADGIRRSIAGQVPFLLHGQQVPILGKICMDYTMLDVTDIPEAKEGDVVTVFGEDGALSFQSYELAACYPGSVGELTSVLNPRIPRFYTRKGKITGRLDE